MQDKIKKFEEGQMKRKMPKIRPGDTVKVYQKIKEGDKERIQFFQGTVIKIHGGYGMNGTFTVRKTASGVGVEKIFPFHLPSITKLEVLKRGKVRRAKLYYLRERQEKQAKLRDKEMNVEDLEKMGFDEVKEKEAAEKKAKAEKEAKEKSDEKKVVEKKKDENPTAKVDEDKQSQKAEDNKTQKTNEDKNTEKTKN